MADRVAVLRDGQIAQYAAPQDLYITPADPQLAGFIGDANLLDGLVAAGPAPAVRTVFGELALTAAGGGMAPGPVTVLVRPEQLAVEAAAGTGPPPGGPCVEGKVVACHYYGHDAVLKVRLTEAYAAPEITVRTAGGPQLAAGTTVLIRATGPVLAWPRS